MGWWTDGIGEGWVGLKAGATGKKGKKEFRMNRKPCLSKGQMKPKDEPHPLQRSL